MARFDFSKENLYSRGAARFKDLVYLSMKDRKLDRKSVLHSRLIAIDNGEWAPLGDLNWATAGMCIVKKPAEKMVAVSPQGEVFTSVRGKRTKEKISPKPVDLRCCAAIGGYAYAAGMKNQVFRRTAEGKWKANHPPADKKDNLIGFEAIDGFDENEIYAVGWKGQIWQLTKKKWMKRSSPTKVVLTSVECAPDNNVYICGQDGTLLRGRNENWEKLSQNNIRDDFWDICWFKNKLYVASMSTIYSLNGGKLIPVDFGKDAPKSCYKLTEAEGVMWSVGQEDLFSFDGKKWTRWD
jgi:hypothetical protein